MQRVPIRPFLVIVVEPANDHPWSEPPVTFWRIRWLRTGRIGQRPG
ncbi:MAG: hypothetical protein K6T74_09460 [Geminicoccaceae bacterium]|nr:hypothetical protein [Geminicoccaceae bacterium]